MLLSLFRSSSVICISVFISRSCSVPQPVCDGNLYGVPNSRDCLSAWYSMPFALEPRDSYNAKRFELYSEPQYLLPAFNGVINRYKPLPINQVPKIWRYSTFTSLVQPQNSHWLLLLQSTDERLFRHMPCCTHELRSTESLSGERTMGLKLEMDLRSDAKTARVRQPPERDRSKWRIHGSCQYVGPVRFPDAVCISGADPADG